MSLREANATKFFLNLIYTLLRTIYKYAYMLNYVYLGETPALLSLIDVNIQNWKISAKEIRKLKLVVYHDTILILYFE